jgi:DNA-binding XRE family transcriptional regulator
VTRPSPYVRRRWLGREIRRLRDEHGQLAEPLARAVGFPRQQLSALENGHLGPDIDLVSAICDYLDVDTTRREMIMDAASDGWAVGWWAADADRMGVRQATYADLESGTSSIVEYALALVPGLLQTPAFADARNRSGTAHHPAGFDPAAAVAARANRQRLLLAEGGPSYEVILDEFAIRRSAADLPIVADQLRHIVALAVERSTITVRLLPIDASIKGHSAPRSAFSIYHYRDAVRSVAVAVDTLTKDLVHTEPGEVEPYLDLYSRLNAAALEPGPSIDVLAATAQQLGQREGAP